MNMPFPYLHHGYGPGHPGFPNAGYPSGRHPGAGEAMPFPSGYMPYPHPMEAAAQYGQSFAPYTQVPFGNPYAMQDFEGAPLAQPHRSVEESGVAGPGPTTTRNRERRRNHAHRSATLASGDEGDD